MDPMIINTSPIAWGIASLVATLGGRYVIESLTPAQRNLLSHPLVRRFIICCMVFLVTRDIVKSLIITVGVVLALEVITNESSRFCILPKMFRVGSMSPPNPQQQDQSNKPAAIPLVVPPITMPPPPPLMAQPT